MLPLLSIALGAFVIGTEGFMLAGLLPGLSSDLGVSIAAAGQLVTVFSLTFALGAPVLAVATGSVDRKRLLLGAMVVFALGNLLAARAHDYGMLVAARITMAVAASAFMPAASAYAVAAVGPERRGRAISVIYVGLTLATVLGSPLGVLLGGRFGWRTTFVVVAALTAVAVGGMWRMLAPQAAARAATPGEQLAAARRPDVLGTLVLSVLSQVGIFALYTYLAPFLAEAVGVTGSGVAAVLFLFGAGGAVGNLVGGAAADRFRSRRLLAAIFVLLSLAGRALPMPVRLPVVVALILLWGGIMCAFPSVQQTRLVRIDPRLAAVTLSLNASAIYLGISLGAAVGAVAVVHLGALSLGFVASACELVALAALRIAPDVAPAGGEAAGLSRRVATGE